MNDAAFLFGLRAGVGEEEALATDDGSFEDKKATMFAGVDCGDLFVKRLLIHTGAVNEYGNDVRMAQAFARILFARIVRRGGALARPFLLGVF